MIKKLKNNFTTPEQSKRLLKLGVPADSADLCYRFYTNLDGRTAMWDTPSVIAENQHIEWSHKLTSGDMAYIPCWSVGRLIEIFIICTPYVEIRLCTRLIEQIVASYEDVIKQGMIDFSKLEE